MKKIKVSNLNTYNECERKYFYDSLGFEIQNQEFYKFKLDLMDFIKECVANNNRTASMCLEKKLSLIKDEWFVLNKEKKQVVEQLKNLISRYFDFEIGRDKEIVEKNPHFFVKKIINGETIEFTGRFDYIFRYPNGQYEAVKYKLGAPKLSSAARNLENKPESSLELALCYEGLNKKYPNILVSYYHLKHKDDRATKIKEIFNDKKNKNIVTAHFNHSSITATLKKLDELDLNKMCDLKTEYHYKQNKDNCDFCLYKNLCNNQAVVKIKPLDKRIKEFVPNNKQKKVIECINGPIRVIAGPGTGKTGTIVARYVNMIKSGIRPENILLLSFSNKAVDELKERIVSLTNLAIDKLEAYTYNSFCFNILKRYQEYLSIKGNIKLISRKAFLAYIVDFINKQIDHYNIEVSFIDPFGKYGFISRLEKVVNMIISRDWLEKTTEELSILLNIDDIEMVRMYHDCAKFIRKSMKKANLINYSDQIRLTEKLLKTYPAISKQLSSIYRYIIVDEFQDTDEFQSNVLYSIAKHHTNICVVGDDDQSIFGWRNAKVENILNFHNAFPNCKDIILTDNYRSTQSIVRLSSQFINKNHRRIYKEINAINNSNNLSIIYKETNNQYDDVVVIIKELLKDYSPNDIAIISRKNSTLSKLEEILRINEIPSKKKANSLRDNPYFYNMIIYMKMSLYCYKEIDDISAYCYLRDILKVDMSFLKYENNIKHSIANSPYYNILLRDMKWMHKQIQSFEAQRKEMYRVLNLPKAFAEFVEKIVEIEEINNLEELYKYFRDIDIYKEEVVIDDDTAYDAVNLLTSHVSKGLEFPVVVVNLNEFAQKHVEDNEEERRVLYVTLTRAKEKLILLDVNNKKKSIYADEIFYLLDMDIAV